MAGVTSNSIVYFLNTLGKNNVASIFSLDLSSGSNVLLYRNENNQIHDAALSPDGSRFAVAMNNANGSRGLFILQKEQKTLTPITSIGTNLRPQLMWFSSGDAIITSGRVNGKQGIWRIPVDGSLPQALNLPASKITEVRLSSDGRRIAFTQTNQLPNQILTLDGNKK
jgi:Tol biopolymer transport system component